MIERFLKERETLGGTVYDIRSRSCGVEITIATYKQKAAAEKSLKKHQEAAHA